MDNRQLLPKLTVDQWIILSLAVIGLLVSFVLSMKSDDNEHVYVWNTDYKLPGTCFSRQWFDISCPGCGMTRSVVCLSQGELTRSLRYNLAGLLLYTYAIGYIGYAIARSAIPVHSFFHSAAAWQLFVWLMLSVLLIQWLLKLTGWF